MWTGGHLANGLLTRPLGFHGVHAMKRSIGGLEVSWALGRVLVTDMGRTEFFDFTVSADLKQIVGRYSSTRPDIEPGDVLPRRRVKPPTSFFGKSRPIRVRPRLCETFARRLFWHSARRSPIRLAY
jgi:hypothetical protein